MPFSEFTVRLYFPTRSTVYLFEVRLLSVILTLQKRRLRLIFFASKISHAVPLFVASNILPVNMLYFETVSSIMHDVSTHSTPRNIRELFIHSSGVHAYNTRFSCADNRFVQKSRSCVWYEMMELFTLRLAYAHEKSI